MCRAQTTPRDWQDEDGSTVLWTLGLSIMILMLGVLSVDLWQVLAVRSEVAGLVDSAVAAGSSGIDPVALRDEGVVVLDEELAQARAGAIVSTSTDIATRDACVGGFAVVTTPQVITVTGRRCVQPVLLRLLVPDAEPFVVVVERTGQARVGG